MVNGSTDSATIVFQLPWCSTFDFWASLVFKIHRCLLEATHSIIFVQNISTFSTSLTPTSKKVLFLPYQVFQMLTALSIAVKDNHDKQLEGSVLMMSNSGEKRSSTKAKGHWFRASAIIWGPPSVASQIYCLKLCTATATSGSPPKVWASK
jgi:hypothetical protein